MSFLSDHNHASKAIYLLGFCVAFALAGDLTLYAVLPVYTSSRGFDLAAVGLILSANRLVRLPLNPLVGLLLSRMVRRPFLLAGLGLGILSNSIYILAPDEKLFLVGRVLWGIAWSLIYIASYCMILDITTADNRAWGSGALQSFYFLALAFFPLLGGFLSDTLGFNTALLVCVFFAGAGFLLASLLLPETYQNAPPTNNPETWKQYLPQRILPNLKQGWLEMKELLNRTNVSISYLQLLVFMVGEGLFMSTITLFIARHLDISKSFHGIEIKAAAMGGAILALRSILSSGIAPLAGKISDRWKNRWGILAFGNVLGVLGMIWIAGVATSVLFLAGVILAALYSGVTIAILPALIEEANPRQPVGKLMGLLTTFGDIGMAIAPLLAYNLLEKFSLQNIYTVGAVLLSSGLAFIWLGAVGVMTTRNPKNSRSQNRRL
ncbi:MAG: MFS transporter [Anaerolineae bacterium]|nr:MFS transporter [Anaerolineae bacterium]